MLSHRNKKNFRRSLAVVVTIVAVVATLVVQVPWMAALLVAATGFTWWRAGIETEAGVSVEVVRELISRARQRDEERRRASFENMAKSLRQVESLAADAFAKLHDNDEVMRGTIAERERLMHELASAAWTNDDENSPAMRLERVRTTLNDSLVQSAVSGRKSIRALHIMDDVSDEVARVIELSQELLEQHASIQVLSVRGEIATFDDGVTVASPEEAIAKFREVGITAEAVLLRVLALSQWVQQRLEEGREEICDVQETDVAAMVDATDEVKDVIHRWRRIQDAADPVVRNDAHIEDKFNERMIAMQFEDMIRQTSEDVRARISDEQEDDGLLGTLDQVCSRIDGDVEFTELLTLLDEVAAEAESVRRRRVSQESLDTGEIEFF